MWDIVITTFNAVAPIILLILLGYFLKRIGFLNKDFVRVGNRLVFRVCLPCLLFTGIYDKMNGFADIRWDVILYSVIALLVIFFLGLLTAILATDKKRRRGVILQCSFRSNFAIIGLALVARLGGDVGVASIVSAFTVPIFNILAVIALTVFSEPQPAVSAEGEGELPLSSAEPHPKERLPKSSDIKKILLGIVKNPLIIGVFIGLVFVGIREIQRACCGEVVFAFNKQLVFLYAAVSDLSKIASPFALIVLGAQFEFSAVKGMTKEIVVGVVWRIVLAPLLGIGTAVLLSKFTPLLNNLDAVYPAFIALFGTPVAVSSAIMAGEMHSDEQLATQLVVWTSVGSVITIFLTVFILMSCGLMTV